MWLGSGTAGPLHGMYGSTEAEFEVQRTIKRALTAFLCLLRKVSGPIKVHVDNKGIIDGLRKGEKECLKPRAGDAHLWIKNWEELHELVNTGISVDVAHVKAHRTKKEKEKMRKIERFVTEGNEKANESAKEGAMLDEGLMAEVRAATMMQEREEVYVALQYAASFHCLVEGKKEAKAERKVGVLSTREGVRMKPRTERCAGSKQVSMYEMRKRKQIHENVR